MQCFFSCNSPLAYSKQNHSNHFKRKNIQNYFLPKNLLQLSINPSKTPLSTYTKKCKDLWQAFDRPTQPTSTKLSSISGNRLNPNKKKFDLNTSLHVPVYTTRVNQDRSRASLEKSRTNLEKSRLNLPPILSSKQKSIFDSWEVDP